MLHRSLETETLRRWSYSPQWVDKHSCRKEQTLLLWVHRCIVRCRMWLHYAISVMFLFSWPVKMQTKGSLQRFFIRSVTSITYLKCCNRPSMTSQTHQLKRHTPLAARSGVVYTRHVLWQRLQGVLWYCAVRIVQASLFRHLHTWSRTRNLLHPPVACCTSWWYESLPRCGMSNIATTVMKRLKHIAYLQRSLPLAAEGG